MNECKRCLSIYPPKTKRSEYCSDTCRQARHGSKNDISDLNKVLKAKGLPVMQRGGIAKIEFLESNIKELNELTGGFPINRITEIYGRSGVGKTFLAKQLIGEGTKTLYVDTENALTDLPENVSIITEHELETISDIVDVALDSKVYDLIVVDSVASMTTRVEVEGDAGDSNMGVKAKLMSQWMRRVNQHLKASGTALVFINQERDSMSPYGKAKFTPGGHALPYASSLRLELKSLAKDKIMKDKGQVGHHVEVKVEKSRVCKPFISTTFKLMY